MYLCVCVCSRVCKCSYMGRSEVNFSIVLRLSHWPETHSLVRLAVRDPQGIYLATLLQHWVPTNPMLPCLAFHMGSGLKVDSSSL